MSQQTADLISTLRARLRATMRRITLAEITFGAILILGLAAACWLLLAGLEAQFWMSTTARSVLVGALVVSVVALALTYVARPLLRAAGRWGHLTESDVAQRIGARYPEVADRLLNLLDLADGRRSNAPPSLVDRAALRLGQDVQDVPFEQVEDFQGARRAGRWAAVPVVLLLAFAGLAPSTFMDASQRLAAPGTTFERPAPFRFQVTPGAARIVKGDSLRITARTVGSDAPRAITLAVRHNDEEHVERVTLTPDSTGRIQHTLVNVRKDLHYRLNAAPVASRWFPVRLTERPLLERLRVRLDYPNYTRMPDRRLDANVGDVKALPGTEVHVETRIGGAAPDTAVLRFDDGRTFPLRLDERAASGQFTLKQSGAYQIRLRSTNGVANRAPITYQTQLLSDELPSVTMLDPSASAELDESVQQGLRMRLSDDFGFSALRLYWRRAESEQAESMKSFEHLRLPLDNPRRLDQEVTHLWKLAPSTGLDLQPGDVIEYYVKVWDNDAVAGYQSARTETHRLRYPSRSEQYDQVDEQQSSAQETMEDALHESEQITNEFDRLRDEMRRKRGADWEDKRQLEQLKKRQQAAESQVEEATQQMQRMTDEMQRNSLSDEETMNMYKELQRVMDEVNAPEMQKAMQQLRKAMETMDMKKLQESLKNTQKSQQQYRQRLKRALSLFKKAKVRQQMEEVAQRAQELAEQEKQLAEQTKRRQREGEKERGGKKTKRGKEEGKKGEKEKGKQGRDEGKKGDEQKRGGQKKNRQSGDQGNSEQSKPQSKSNEKQSGKKQPGRKSSGQKSENQQSRKRPSDKKKKQRANEDLARKQDAARKQMQKLQKKMQKLQKGMKSTKSTRQKQMKKLQQQMQKQQISKQMRKNSRQLRKNQMQKARQGQKRMQKQLQQMSKRMQRMQKQMRGKQRQINLAGLRQALSDVLTLSQQQEGLRMGVRGLSSGDAQLRPYARRQEKLSEGLRTVSDTLQHLANNIPQMRREVQEEAGSALEEMNAAVGRMSDRKAGRAAGHQKASMMHLNELALMLSDLLTNMQPKGGQGSGMSMQQMMKKLQQMAGQQQKLNQQIQQMLNKAQGKRLSPNKQNRLRQMARQQEALQRQLEKMSRNRNVRGKALGDLKKIADDMKKTVKEMRRRGASQRTIKRQRRIHTRLLNAQRSINKRGTKKERKSRTGEDVQRESPDELTPPEQAEKLRRDLIRALDKGYAPDYEQLIKRYFELLQQSSE